MFLVNGGNPLAIAALEKIQANAEPNAIIELTSDEFQGFKDGVVIIESDVNHLEYRVDKAIKELPAALKAKGRNVNGD